MVLFCSLAFLDPRVGHTMDVLSPFISILCHSNWLFHRESCPRLDVVYPVRAWTSLPACTWLCSLHYFFIQAISLCPHGMTIDHRMLASLLWPLTVPSLLQLCCEFTHLFFFAVHETRIIFLSPFIRPQDVFLHSFWVSSSHSRTWLQATLALSLVLSSLKSIWCDFSINSV